MKFSPVQLAVSGMVRGKRAKFGAKSKIPLSNGDENPRENYRSYAEIVKENENFTKYYQTNKIPSESVDEWKEFVAVAQKPLPSTFRITGSRSHAIYLRDHLKSKYFSQLESAQYGGENSETLSVPPHSIPWYPEEFGWTVEGSKASLRKDEIYQQLHKFLVNETEIGNISRQEAVSMIPPLLLDVQGGHCVLDMCAAPGSKTTQLIESLHRQDSTGKLASGLVIANDADNKRCYTLAHQAKRLQSPALLVTNHDASIFPKIMRINDNQEAEAIKFDRILCDVPCSGDGTMRKNPLIWRSWNAMQANGLHTMQLKILERGCHLLKENGLIVYSTCSLNPVENEAVISELLSKYPESLELVDVSSKLSELKRNAGITHWKVMDKAGQLYDSFDQIPSQFQEKFKPSMFPSCKIEQQNIHRCMRLYPHLQNTGGFFVALLKKTAPLGTATTTSQPNSFIPKQAKFDGFKEKPFILMNSPEDQNEITQIFDCFGIAPSTFPKNQYLVRSNEGKNRTIYYCSHEIQQILTATNEFGFNESLKIINTGIKGFSKSHTSNCQFEFPYRLHFEHVQNIKSAMTKRIVKISLGELKLCLENEFVPTDSFSPESIGQFGIEGRGCFVFCLSSDPTGDISFPVWIGKSSVTIYLIPEEKRSILERLFTE